MDEAPLLDEAQAASIELGIARWLADFALERDDQAGLLAGFCERLTAVGLPLFRVALGYEVFHPTVDAAGVRWRQGVGIEHEAFTRNAALKDAAWLRQHPFTWLVASGEEEMRRRVGLTYRPGEFELLDDLVRKGMTDYVGILVRYGAGSTLGVARGVIVSFQTCRAGGFREDELQLLRRLSRQLGLAYKAAASVQTGRALLGIYLGADPARRVLEGAILRGRAEPVHAVLWFSDLEGFTRIADTAPRDAVLALLNDYADCLVSTIAAHGGEVLKFMGDGILAMFPLSDASPCGRALDAAQAALANLERLSAQRTAANLPAAGIHLALHVGEVLYGNIGSRERLDFTVVGPAVNEVARIEALCRQLDQPVLVSAAFAQAAGEERRRLVSVGRYALRGVRRPEELFTLDAGGDDRAAGVMP